MITLNTLHISSGFSTYCFSLQTTTIPGSRSWQFLYPSRQLNNSERQKKWFRYLKQLTLKWKTFPSMMSQYAPTVEGGTGWSDWEKGYHPPIYCFKIKLLTVILQLQIQNLLYKVFKRLYSVRSRWGAVDWCRKRSGWWRKTEISDLFTKSCIFNSFFVNFEAPFSK